MMISRVLSILDWKAIPKEGLGTNSGNDENIDGRLIPKGIEEVSLTNPNQWFLAISALRSWARN